MVSRPALGSVDDAWVELAGGPGITDVAEGGRVVAATGAARLAGRVECVIEGAHHRGVALRTDEPAPGIVLVFVNAWRDTCYANLNAYLFGEVTSAAGACDEQTWRRLAGDALSDPTGNGGGSAGVSRRLLRSP